MFQTCIVADFANMQNTRPEYYLEVNPEQVVSLIIDESLIIDDTGLTCSFYDS